MRTAIFVLVICLVGFIGESEAKRLKPKYYKACYADYKEMRKLVPKPAMDVQKTAKTVNAVAGIAGRFGGFGGLGSAASTAATVAKYSETIADVAAFTESMKESYPVSADRLRAYGDRMKTESADMAKVAEFSTSSQACYAQAYVDLKQASDGGEMKSREVRKRQKEIQTGVGNVSEMLTHATLYMDTNIDAYNKVMNQEASGAGFSLDKILKVANQAADVAGSVKSLDAPSYPAGYTGSVHAEGHRQAMKLHYEAAGIPNPHPAPALPSEGYFGGMSSLSTLAAFGSINPGVGAAAAMQMGVAEANLQAAGQKKAQLPPAMQQAQPSTEDNFKALMDAGADIKPYLDSYNEIKGLSEVQQSVAAFVDTPI